MKRTELWAENWARLGVAAIGAHTQCLAAHKLGEKLVSSVQGFQNCGNETGARPVGSSCAETDSGSNTNNYFLYYLKTEPWPLGLGVWLYHSALQCQRQTHTSL